MYNTEIAQKSVNSEHRTKNDKKRKYFLMQVLVGANRDGNWKERNFTIHCCVKMCANFEENQETRGQTI